MALSCSYVPHNKNGEELIGFKDYRNNLGYKMAAEVFTQVIAPSFKRDFKKILELDKQGVPTYNSAIKVPYIKNLIGNSELIKTAQKEFPFVENTRENYKRLIESAHTFNNTEGNDKIMAVVTQSKDGNEIRVEIRELNQKNMDEYRNQYGASVLNEKIEELLGDLGIDISLLERNEYTNGFIDLTKADSIANGFIGLINIANGMEGELALSEEFSHVLIEMFGDTPLVQRSLAFLANNDAVVQEILGDEYAQNKDYYQKNPNYDVLGNEIPLSETLAEEALGRVLQEKLKTTSTTPTNESGALSSLIKRLISFIKRVFRGKDSDSLTKARNDVNEAMGKLAQEVLSGTRKLSKEELIKKKRNAKFQHVRDSTDKILQLLKKADEIERKRAKIAPDTMTADIKKRITTLESLMTDTNKLRGVHEYAKWALADLQDAMDKLSMSGTMEAQSFPQLNFLKSVLDSYSGFIEEFHKMLDEIGEDAILDLGDQELDLRELWRDIEDLYVSCTDAFKEQALAAFSDFLAPVYEKSPLRDEDGNIIPIREVLTKEDFDISEFDRWMTSMGNSSSIILQMFDKVVKNAKDKVRLGTRHNIRDIWRIRDNAEKRGITSFDWMFERDRDGHKTGNYISAYNRGQFNKDLEEMKKRIEEKYGKFPVGENYRKAFLERKAWYEQNASLDMFGKPFPNDKYKNPEYSKLTQAQKDTLKEILDYKNKLEEFLPANRRNKVRAIQRRRGGAQRILDTVSNIDQAYNSIADDLKSAFRSAEDDDILYGESTHGLTDFTGQEYMTLPILYTGRLKNPDNLSTDVIGDLMAYAYMVNTYKEMSEIYDPLKIGTAVVANKDFVKNVGSKVKEEVIQIMGRKTKSSIKVGTNTSFAKKLRDYLECQVYGRYMKEDDIFGKNTQKTLTVFQRLSSVAYLGCNYLAGVANVATAVGMQNIEAAAGEFFGAKELAKADIEYGEMLPEFIAELADRKKQSKLALFDELFDVRQNAKDKIHNVQKKNILQRFFGKNWLFVQQGLGDHWIYNRTAIAMAKKKQVKVNGKQMSVWDALEIVTEENGYKIMQVKKGTYNLDGSVFEAGQFSREIAHINHTIAGIYNDEDQNAANRVIVGRLAQQMRKWIVPQMMRRFQSKRTILDIGKEEEGYYRTFGRLSKDLWKSGFKFTAEWDRLNASEKANVMRAITEISQTIALFILTHILGGAAKDPDRNWAIKFAEYMANRELHELGFLTPSPLMLTEGYKTITSPFVAASAANKLAQALLTTINPWNWFPDDDELIKSGRYEGHSYIYKRFMELPLPPITQWRQIDKLIEDLDESTKYYSKDYK